MANINSDRGKRPSISKNGEVHGSGAGAGGGNPGEDYDDDPVGGGGKIPGQARTEAEGGEKGGKKP